VTPGFEFRFRVDGSAPTVRSFTIGAPDAVSRGDLITVDGGAATPAATGDRGIVGVAVETLLDTAGTAYVRAVTDADAVYAVADPSARAAGTPLGLTGATGAQRVTDGDGGDLRALLDRAADESTLVGIAPGRHRSVGDEEGRDLPLGASLNSALARAVVRTYRRHVGRGPSAAQAFYQGEAIVVLLAGALTPAERSLAEGGRDDVVLRARRALHQTMSENLSAAVEELTGRRVIASMNANHIGPDMSAEVFLVDRPLPAVVPADGLRAAPRIAPVLTDCRFAMFCGVGS
jgi:uncharacterized protein YbcI